MEFKKYYIVVVIVSFIIAGEGALLLFSHEGIRIHVGIRDLFFKDSKEYNVVLTEEGFSPANLVIEKGDKVRFTTERKELFWPASNIHPYHEIYPEFDPREPIDPQAAWTFQFTKDGKWGYHDHLFPLYKGTIIVEKRRGEGVGDANPCKDLGQPKSRCWEYTIHETLREKGLPEALKLLARLFTTERAFASSCHVYAHSLGEEAYELFAQGQHPVLTSETYYCGYGFYHGFMEALISKGGSPSDAGQFCADAAKKLQGQTSDAGGSCFHGIGHGFVDGSDPRAFGDPEKLIGPALAMCSQVAKTELQLERCAGGVFNSLAIMYMFDADKFKITVNREDPFWICRKQSAHPLIKACHEEMNTLLMYIAGNDFGKAVLFPEAVKEDIYATSAVRSLAAYAAHSLYDKENHSKVIATCQGLQDRLRPWCIAGFAAGLMEFGEPETAYKVVVGFCQSDVLQEFEREKCYSYGLGLARTYYHPSKYKEVCEIVEEKYKKFCPGSPEE